MQGTQSFVLKASSANWIALSEFSLVEMEGD
jgi:hypothetical protein